MSDEHITRDLFRAISGGWRNPGDLAAIALAHLFELCPRCRREFQAWRGELGEGAPAHGPEDYEAVLDRLRARAAPKPANSNEPPGAVEAKAEAEEREARSRAEELLGLSPVEQAELIRREPERFSGLLLAEMLIEDSRKKAPDRPKEAAVSARLARLVLHHTSVSGYAGELYVRALAYLANSVRVIGDLPRADQILGDARYFFRSLGCGNRLLRAELDSLEGSLRTGQFRAELAVSLLLRALMVYRLDRQPRLAASTLLSLSCAHNRRGSFEAALRVVEEAKRLLERSPDRRLAWIAHHSQVNSLVRAGNLRLAIDSAYESEEVVGFERDPVSGLRWKWVMAKVRQLAGDMEEAASTLASVREEFGGRGLVYDEAQAALELAALYADEGCSEQATGLLGETLPVFRRLEVSTKVAEAEALARRLARR